MALRCVLVDDNPGFLRAASLLLEAEGLRVVGTATSPEDAVRRVAECRPDVTLLDLDLRGRSGLELAARLAGDPQLRPGVLVIVSAQAEEDVADLVADSAAAGFVPKASLSAAAIERLVGGADTGSR